MFGHGGGLQSPKALSFLSGMLIIAIHCPSPYLFLIFPLVYSALLGAGINVPFKKL